MRKNLVPSVLDLFIPAALLEINRSRESGIGTELFLRSSHFLTKEKP